MARPIRTTQTGVGVTVPYGVNLNVTPCNIAVAVKITGSVTYTVQHTYDNIFGDGSNTPLVAPAAAVWYSNSTLANQTANADGNYNYPPVGIRLSVTAGTGTATLTVVQAGLNQS